MDSSRKVTSKVCVQFQVNRNVEDFYCDKGYGHQGGHKDPKSGKIWGTPARPYGVRGSKASSRRKVR